MEIHGGRITAASLGAGWGATFTLALPRAKLDRSIVPKPATGDIAAECDDGWRDDQQLSALRVLIVDDDQDTLEVAGIVLEAAGATVRAARSSREASRDLRNGGPTC